MTQPMIFRQKGTTLKVIGPILQRLIDSPQPILWCNEGLYELIPMQRIQNDLSVLSDKQKLIGSNISLVFLWGQGKNIDPKYGKFLEQNRNEGSDVGESIDNGGLPTGH